KLTVPLTVEADGTLTASFKADQDGSYHVELDAPNGERVAASPQYTIDVLTDRAPTVSFARPGRDTSASAIEEVYVEASADDDYGVKNLELVYSVNGGAEKVVPLYNGSKRLPSVSAGHTFYHEELGVKSGDSVSYYARATDNDAVDGGQKATSDLYFVRVRPFDQRFRQAQSQGGGGGGGQVPADLNRRRPLAAEAARAGRGAADAHEQRVHPAGSEVQADRGPAAAGGDRDEGGGGQAELDRARPGARAGEQGAHAPAEGGRGIRDAGQRAAGRRRWRRRAVVAAARARRHLRAGARQDGEPLRDGRPRDAGQRRPPGRRVAREAEGAGAPAGAGSRAR